MPKILFISFRWNDERLKMHSSDKMMALGFSRAGWDIEYYDYRFMYAKFGTERNNQNAYKKIMEENPDILFLNKCEKLDPSIITRARKNGFKGTVVYWHMDQRKLLIKSVVEWSKVSDWVFHCKGGWRLKEYYEATQTPTSFLFSPYEPSYINDKEFSKRDLKLTWYGQLYDTRQGFDSLRREIIPFVRGYLSDYGACFEQPFVRGEEYYDKLTRSKISISIPAIDMPYYFSNRHSHLMGSGAVVFSYRFQNCLDMFTDGYNIVTFKNSKELINKSKYYLNNIEELQAIQQHSKEFAKEYLTSDKVCQQILHTLKNGKSSYPFDQTINPNRKEYTYA